MENSLRKNLIYEFPIPKKASRMGFIQKVFEYLEANEQETYYKFFKPEDLNEVFYLCFNKSKICKKAFNAFVIDLIKQCKKKVIADNLCDKRLNLLSNTEIDLPNRLRAKINKYRKKINRATLINMCLEIFRSNVLKK